MITPLHHAHHIYDSGSALGWVLDYATALFVIIAPFIYLIREAVRERKNQ